MGKCKECGEIKEKCECILIRCDICADKFPAYKLHRFDDTLMCKDCKICEIELIYNNDL